MNSFIEVWENVCIYCRSHIHEVAYNTWIHSLQPVELKENKAIIRSRSQYQKTIVENHYVDLLNKGFEEIFGFPITVEIVVGESTLSQTERSADEIAAKYTFDNFVVGSSNKFAHAASLAVANDPGHAYNPLFIYGNPGLGKTHLLNAMRNEINKKFPEKTVVYTQGEAFMNEIIEAINNVSTVDFREKYRKADVLFIDDIQFIAGKEATQIEFFNTFEALYQDNKQIIVTSDRLPKDIKSLDERIRGRLEMGLTADIQQPDFETRVSIIRRKAQALQFDIPDVVVQYIANQLKNNVRQLEGIVNKLYAYHNLGEEPTLNSAGNMINEIRKDEMPEPISLDQIVASVSSAFDVSVSDICSSKQNSEIANARHISLYIAREVTGSSLKSIGKYFGRNHATVSASLRKVETELMKNSRIKSTIDDIIKNLTGK